MWQMIKENLETKAKRTCGTYTSFKQGLQYAPEVLDGNLEELNAGIDERDEMIGDFMQMGGKVAIVFRGYQFYLTKRIRDDYGNTIANPSGCIRIGGKAEWRNGKDIRIVVVEAIAIDKVSVVSLDSDRLEATVPWNSLKAA